MRFRLITVLTLFFLCLSGSQAFPVDQVVGIDGQSPIYGVEQFDLLEDPSQELTVTDVQRPDVARRFQPVQRSAEALNFGYSQSAFWLRLALKNDSNAALATVLQIGKAHLSSVLFHHRPLPNGVYETINTGGVQPFSSRAHPSRFFVFPLTLPAQQVQVVYLRIQSDSAVMIPVKLWTAQAFHAYERADYVWQALYFGLAIGAILFNLLLFAVIRDISLLLYVAFSSSMVFALAAQNGLLAQYLPWHSLLLARISAPVGFSLTLVAALFFMRHMLQPRLYIRNINMWLKALIGLNLLMAGGYVISVPAFAAAPLCQTSCRL